MGMLDMGFHGDVTSISGQVRPERQVLFFSATWSQQVQDLARGLCHESRTPVRMSVGVRAGAPGDLTEHKEDGDGRLRAREGIAQEVVVLDNEDWRRNSGEKRSILDSHIRKVLAESEEHKILVFVNEKQLADEVSQALWTHSSRQGRQGSRAGLLRVLR